MGPLLYMWSVNDRNVVMQCVVVVISAQNKTEDFTIDQDFQLNRRYFFKDSLHVFG